MNIFFLKESAKEYLQHWKKCIFVLCNPNNTIQRMTINEVITECNGIGVNLGDEEGNVGDFVGCTAYG